MTHFRCMKHCSIADTRYVSRYHFPLLSFNQALASIFCFGVKVTIALNEFYMHVNFQFHDCNEYANDLNTLEFFRLVVDSAHAFTLSSTLFHFAVAVSIKCNRNIFLKMHYGLGRERELVAWNLLYF